MHGPMDDRVGRPRNGYGKGAALCTDDRVERPRPRAMNIASAANAPVPLTLFGKRKTWAQTADAAIMNSNFSTTWLALALYTLKSLLKLLSAVN